MYIFLLKKSHATCPHIVDIYYIPIQLFWGHRFDVFEPLKIAGFNSYMYRPAVARKETANTIFFIFITLFFYSIECQQFSQTYLLIEYQKVYLMLSYNAWSWDTLKITISVDPTGNLNVSFIWFCLFHFLVSRSSWDLISM